MSQQVEKKQEADFSKDVETLIPEAQQLARAGSLDQALEKVFALEKKARNAADLASTTRLLLLAVLLIRTTPSPDQTNWNLLSETLASLSKKHGQLKQAITKMVQLAMSFLHKPVDPVEERRLKAEQEDEEMKDAAAEKEKEKEKEKEDKKGDKKVSAAEKKEIEKVGKENEGVTALMDEGKRIGDTGMNEETRKKLVETLRTVTEGKIFVEVERARVTLILSQMLYSKGKVHEAAETLQELAVETFGSMDRREKVEFILEQMRLNYERKDFVRMAIVSKKINTKFFEDEKNHDLKLRFYDLMIQHALHFNKFLDACKYYREIHDTPQIKADPARAADILRNVIVFLALSPYDNEQSDLMARVETTEGLDTVPEHRNLLKCFTTPELMRWPGIEAMYAPMLRATPTFAPGKDGDYRWEELHKRIVEHNIRVVSQYYTKITLQRLSQLLDLTPEKSESSLAALVSSGTVYAKMDRPAGVVNFEAKKSNTDILNAWSSDMQKLLATVEKVTHLVEKEWAVHRAGISSASAAAAKAE
ncbi:putative RPN5-26S proteasome regulatory subunit [Violaceomyces palustris]|uniref:RPN5-26S proteasome regulatory subunit n=1 Tax=Violaceomyces palustris TaxID=1673888 RepID=A0ACD0P3B2_9BASI|nr:putative RPN5-26S proteasome regulatory subunit [Violaceomyces palustris]